MKSLVGVAVAVIATIVAAVTVVLVVIVAAPDVVAIFDTEVGDCFELPIGTDDVDLAAVDLVACNEPHDAQVVAAGKLNPQTDRAYPAPAALFREVDQQCERAAQRHSIDRSEFGLLPVAPNRESWMQQDGQYRCVAVTVSGELVRGGVIGSN